MWGFCESGMIYVIRSSPTIKTPIEVTRNPSQEENSGSEILQQSWCHWLTVEQPVCKNKGQKRVTCKGKVDDSTEHSKTLNLLSQIPCAVSALATNHLQPAGRHWDSTKALLSLQSLFAQYLLSIHILKRTSPRCTELWKVHNEYVKSHNHLCRFLRLSSREYRLCFPVTCSPVVNVIWQSEKRTLLTRKRDPSRYVCLCVLSYRALFFFLCKALWH